MTTTIMAVPKFSKDQQVRFAGGEGMIRSYQPDSGMWTYAVEMELGPEPNMGRVAAKQRSYCTKQTF